MKELKKNRCVSFSFTKAYLAVKMATRKAVEIPFLNESPLSEILGAKLPTGLTIFRHLWHRLKVLNEAPNTGIRETAKAVITFWENAGMKTKKIDCIAKDLTKLYNQHKVLHDILFDFRPETTFLRNLNSCVTYRLMEGHTLS